MGTWTLFTSNRVDDLVETLADRLEHDVRPPLEDAVVLVQSRGLSRYLELSLCKRHGIAAGLRMPFLGSWLQSLPRQQQGAMAEQSDKDPWSRDALTLRIFRLLGDPALASELEAAAVYVRNDSSHQKRLHLAQALAQRFDDYQVYRPEWLLDFARGNCPDLPHARWQQRLWRRLLDERNDDLGAHRIASLTKLLTNKPDWLELPERVSVFGVTAIAPAFLDLLALVAKHSDVDLYVQRPTNEFFSDLKRSRRGEQPPGPALLRNLGGQCREFFDQLQDREDRELQHESLEATDPGTDCLLHALQSDILNLRDRRTGGDTAPLALATDDASLTVHSAHGTLREMEILRDQLLARFERDSTLSPVDVLVLLPDVDAYAPYVHAAFAPVQHLFRTTTADRSPADSLPLASAFLSLFELSGSRYSAADVLQLVEDDALLRRFDITRAQLPQLRDLVDKAKIRWGIDGEQRDDDLGLPRFEENSWTLGLRRLALGAATGDMDGLVLGIAPASDATMARATLIGSFLAMFDAIAETAKELDEPRSLSAWAAHLDDALDRLFAPQSKAERAAMESLRAATQRMRTLQDAIGGEPLLLRANAVAEWMRAQLADKGEGRGFLSGSLTFASMRPMRSVPMRVIAVCGLHDGSFPRSADKQEFDLMQHRRKVGDRNKREDDRQLFLDALLAAKDAVVLTYVGRSAKDNSEHAPSPVLEELLDHVDAAFTPPRGYHSARKFVHVEHPLQSFSSRYGASMDPRLFTYANDRAHEDAPPRAAKRDESNEGVPTIELNDLLAFWKAPQEAYCKQTLGLRYPGKVNDESDSEPFTMHALDKYQLLRSAIERSLDTQEPACIEEAERQRGSVPPGPMGQIELDAMSREAEAFADRIRSLHGTRTLRVEIRRDRYVLVGQIDSIGPRGALRWRPSDRKSTDLLHGYIVHCVRQLAETSEPMRALPTIVVGKDGESRWESLENAEAQLDALVDAYLQGLTSPPPVPPLAGWAFASRLCKPKKNSVDPELEALDDARKAYFEGNAYGNTRHDLPNECMTLCFGHDDPTRRAAFVEQAKAIHVKALESMQEQQP